MKYYTDRMRKHLSIYKIFLMVKDGSSVLDVGCFAGFLGGELKEKKRCKVTGIDNDAKAISMARRKLDFAILADIEEDKIAIKKKFDCIIFADVLEHTRDPEKVLRKFLPMLKKGGSVLVSLPNVAHPINRVRLLAGKWDYTETGIMDKTHLRFYTYKTARALLENSGLRIVEEKKAGRFPVKTTLSAQFVFRCEAR